MPKIHVKHFALFSLDNALVYPLLLIILLVRSPLVLGDDSTCVISTCYRYYQDLAVNILESLYQEDEMIAYRSLVSDLRYWGKGVTPLTIADDGEAMKFMGRSCCQTFLHRVWLQCMDLGTSSWKVQTLLIWTLATVILSLLHLLTGSFHDRKNKWWVF